MAIRLSRRDRRRADHAAVVVIIDHPSHDNQAEVFGTGVSVQFCACISKAFGLHMLQQAIVQGIDQAIREGSWDGPL